MPSCRKPVSTVSSLPRLRENRSAPATSTSESATCATTSARRKPNRWRPAVIPCPPVFSTALGSQRLPHGNLALARARPRQQQIRQVGAGDQQHQPGNRQQQPERLLVL